ncbi:MAG: hypothetical protein ACTSWW_00490, partial [Promethearchaeota archaeon]
SIKKNEKRSLELEKELQKLQKDAGSVDEAMTQAKDEAEAIQDQINTLRNEIDEKKSQQKKIDKEIQKLETQKEKTGKTHADVQAAISSSGAEINMLETRITELEQKKVDYQKEYDALTGGNPVEDQINNLKSQESELSTQLQDAKEKLRKSNEDQKRGQTQQEGLEQKRRTLEGELSDLGKRLSGLRVELKNTENELHTAQRDKQKNDIIKTNLGNEVAQFTQEKEKIQGQSDGYQTKMDQLKEQHAKLQETIDKKEDEQGETQEELNTVLETLMNLMQNIDHSAGDVKADIQNVSQVAIDESRVVLKNFVMDISEMLQSVEEISQLIQENPEENLQMMTDAVTTMRLLIENIEEPLAQLNEVVEEASDEALHESTANFDGFIQDFTEKFDSIRVALQAVAVADTSEHYRALENLNIAISAQSESLADAQVRLTKLSTQIEQKEKELNQTSTLLNSLEKKIEENNKKVFDSNMENTEKSKKAEELETEIAQINTTIADAKKSSDSYWNDNKVLQAEIDTKSDELFKITEDLNALGNVKRLLEDIEAATGDQTRLSGEIQEKKQTITDLSTKSEKIQEEIENITENITTVKAERESAEDARNELQGQIDDENEKLAEVNGRIKDLENVQKLITDIENLTRDNEENTEKIAENTKENEGMDEHLKEFDEQINNHDQDISTRQEERQKLEDEEQQLRANEKELNGQMNGLEKLLDRKSQMKAREYEIEQLLDEVGATGDQIGEYQDNISDITKNLETLEQTRSDQINTITDLQGQRSDSWEKQKSYRDDLGDLNADYSRNTAKFNGLETRKIVIEEKIDDLFEKSKDYGTLPPVTDDLSEENLNQKIGKASTEKKALEPVNLKSIEEYDDIKERWDEIDMRRQTLQRERKAILDSIDRIELEKTRNFMKAYHEINRVFSTVFQKLSPGGSAKMMLENPAHPFEGGITIEARPRGKKISSLEILSGGEKTLVALSFIFAIQNFYPAPFYIMDEIDAALDGPNVYRVSMVIKEYANESQFLVISHREENITNADRIYGVAMNNGITDIFTVDLEEEKARDDFDTEVEIVEIEEENKDTKANKAEKEGGANN